MRIPDNARKVFEGILADIYHYPVKLYDGSDATFELISRKSTAGIIPLIDEKIIVLNQEQPGKTPYFSLIGGFVERDETPENAARRELKEEMGASTNSLRKIREYDGNSKVYMPEHIFVINDLERICDPDPDPGEKITPNLITFDEFLQLGRDPRFAIPSRLRMELYEAIIDSKTKKKFYDTLRNQA